MRIKTLIASCLAILCSVIVIGKPTVANAEETNDKLTSTQIDELFVEVGSNLGYWNFEESCWVAGSESNYLAKYSNSGDCIQSGFKLVKAGDNISGKTLYIYSANGKISDFINGCESANHEYSAFVAYGDYAIFTGGSGERVVSELITADKSYLKIKVPLTVEYLKSTHPYYTANSNYSLFYVYEESEDFSDLPIESDEESIQNSDNSWWQKNSTPLIIGGCVVLGLIILLVIIKRV